MEKVINYFKHLLSEKLFKKHITVYGYGKDYETDLISSVVPYLFEKLEIKENIAPENNENRDRRIREKKYIVIHDTGDVPEFKNAFFWSEVVRTMNHLGSKYAASYHYVVGNDGIYHNIPDNEIAYHAGDSTYFDYALYDTKIEEAEKCDITIYEGYYFINGENTFIKSPQCESQTVTTADFNDHGILCKVVNGTYHLGETYFNETYKKIANRGGNNNGIGMEVCINEGADIYLNYQRSAKLTAYLMDKFNLTIEDVKPHHYFSGKPCPATLKNNGLWDYFLQMVKIEYDVLQFIKEGYEIKFISNTNNILENGRVINPLGDLSYKIIISYQGVTEELNG